MKMKPMSEILEERNPMLRIAEAWRRVLRLVKKDQEEAKKRWEDADKE
jgi:hypothetical protein